MATISAVLIMKNEEALLERCLKSLEGVDELILCDTGSIDKTVEVGEKFVGKGNVKFFQWCDDFAKARNYAKSFATSDYILSIDADEILHDVAKLRDTVDLASKKGILAIDVTMIAEDNGQNFFFPRLFKNDPKVWWEGAIHNHVSVAGERIYDTDGLGTVKITHGYSPAHRLDPDRALRILSKVVDETQNAREMFYLAREYWYRLQYDKCIDLLKIYVTKSKFISEKADGYLMMARCYWATHRPDEARTACSEALVLNANFKEAALFLADMSFPHNAIQWRRLAETANNDGVLFIRA